MIQTLKITLLLLGSVISVILQTTLLAKLSIFGSSPDLPLALIVSIALFKGPFYGVSAGFTLGLLFDLFSGGPLGVQSFSKVVVGYCMGFVSGRFYSDNYITQSASGFIATLVSKIITLAHLSLLSADPQFRFSGLIISGILNSVLVMASFRVLKKVLYERET